MTDVFNSEGLIAWFESEKRILPWRDNPSPYSIWVSEVMLQQTQVPVVIPYFERWMARFPTIIHLANASLEEVIKLWEGLGYYSRARNLLEGAKMICSLYNGAIPECEHELKKIKGLGPYTIGAIRSFAFRKKAAAVDGNVLRVLTRYFQIFQDIAKPSTLKHIRTIVENFLPDDKHWIVNEGLIELGATICTRKPNCRICPLKKECKSFQNGLTSEIPFKAARPPTIPLCRAVAVVIFDKKILVKKGGEGEIMQDLYEFPYLEIDKKGMTIQALSAQIAHWFEIDIEWKESLPIVFQSFTKYKAELRPHLFLASSKGKTDAYSWKTKNELLEGAFSSGHRKIFNSLNCVRSSYLPQGV